MDKKQRLDSMKTTTLNQKDVFDCQNSMNSRDSGVRDAPLKNEVQIENLEDKADPSQVISTKTSSEAKARYNIRALTKHAETYELETFKKNALIIIRNYEKMISYSDVPIYNVTVEDAKALKTTFEEFGFEVTEYEELSKKEIFDRLATFFAKDFTDYGCVGIAVLTDRDPCELMAQGQYYDAMHIMEYFNVHDKPTLVTKPKFLIIQGCEHMKSSAYTLGEISRQSYHLPVVADILYLHSHFITRSKRLIEEVENITPSIWSSTFCPCFPLCFTRNYTRRWERTGCSFIQFLCNKINLLAATHDVESIIAEVKQDIVFEKLCSNEQVPVTTTTLIRKLYLKKFGDPPMLLPEGATCGTSDDEADPLNREAARP